MATRPTRYNYELGHAWNHGADYEFRNTNYGTTGDESRRFLGISADAGIASRVAVPTLGWVASDDLDSTCSFPDGDGGCLAREEVGDCAGDGPRADPRRANVESTPEQVTAWIEGLIADGLAIEYLAMDNEPELWGGQHFDVHPDCPTYEEILDKYLTYARALRDVAPEAALAGPVMCCWYDYWRTAPGPADGSGTPFLEWFLSNVAAHDADYGRRTLDVVDVHYYPQSDVYNDDTSEETNARRLRSTRSLWDPEYRDESWITEPIRFIPRMKETIERSYPGTPLFISEWNFGAETSINGALAIADALGIFGREGVDAADLLAQPARRQPWMDGVQDARQLRRRGFALRRAGPPRHEQRRGCSQCVRRARRGDGDRARHADQQAAQRCVERRSWSSPESRRRRPGASRTAPTMRRRSCPARQT